MNTPGRSSDIIMVEGADAFEAWLSKAQRGDRVVYAVATEFPRATACGILANQWLRLQLVVTVFQKTGDGRTRFIAERTGKSLFDAVSVRSRAIADDAGDEGPGACILRQIRRCANFGMPAPSLREMAKAAGLADNEAGRAAARRALNALRAAGHVRHENSNDGNQRRFILPDGRKTGWLNLRGVAEGRQ